MKFLKLMFSRLVLIIIAILLQIFIFITANFYLTEYFAWIDIIFDIIGFLVLINVICRSEPSSYKLPWVVIILIFPIIGITLYILFGSPYFVNNNQLKDFNENKKINSTLLNNLDDKLKEESLYAYNQAKYILNTTNLPLYKNCYNEYLKSGEEFFKSLLEELKKAKKFIFMEYFIIGEGCMWNEIHDILLLKVKEGVEVHVMYDDVGSISKVSNDFVFKLRDEGINACKFNPLKMIVSVRYNNRDHRKITVIDGEVGFISGANISDEYININSPFGIWKDNALLMKGECVNSLTAMFLELYNFASIKNLNLNDYLILEHKKYENKGYIMPYRDGPRPIYQDYIGMNVYLNIINQSKEYIYISTPYLIVEYEFIQALINASKRGVDVRVITPQIGDKQVIKIMTKSYYQELIESGVKLYEFKDGFIHAKTFLCDDEFAVVGTINLDYRSFVHHFECGVWMYNTDSLSKIKEDFIDLFDTKTIEITLDNSKLSIIERPIFILLRLLTPLL